MPVPKTDALPLGYTPYGLLKGWLAHLRDDEILERFDRENSHYSELCSIKMFSPPPALARIGTFMRW